MATRFVGRIEPALVERRSATRCGGALVDMALGDAAPSPATLLDISPFGCRLRSLDAPAAGGRVMLRFAQGGEAVANVVWREGATVGCRFDGAIARTLLRRLTLLIQ